VVIVDKINEVIPDVYVTFSTMDGSNIVEYNGRNIAWVVLDSVSTVGFSYGGSTQSDIATEVLNAKDNLMDWMQEIIEGLGSESDVKYNESVVSQTILVTLTTKIRG
jgi:hypothetical protein